MLECADVQRLLQPYLDDEIDGEERIFISAHLQSCERCQRQARFERACREQVQRHAEQPAAPPWLRQKVLRALDEVDRPERPLLGWLRLAIPAAVAAMLVFGVVVSKRSGMPIQAATLADQSIERHRQDLPMDVSGPSHDTIRRFFSDKVRFAVRPPVFEQASTQLVGGRLSNLREHQAAYLIYQVGGRRVSVFIFDASELTPEGTLQRVGRRNVLWSRRHGYNVAMYQNGDTGYLVASDLEHQQLVRLINHLR